MMDELHRLYDLVHLYNLPLEWFLISLMGEEDTCDRKRGRNRDVRKERPARVFLQ